MILTKEEMIHDLKNGICEVVFTKQIGENRILNCTLSPLYLPDSKPSEKIRTESTTDAIKVYDVDNVGWRSFNVVNVISFRYISP